MITWTQNELHTTVYLLSLKQKVIKSCPSFVRKIIKQFHLSFYKFQWLRV